MDKQDLQKFKPKKKDLSPSELLEIKLSVLRERQHRLVFWPQMLSATAVLLVSVGIFWFHQYQNQDQAQELESYLIEVFEVYEERPDSYESDYFIFIES